MSNETRIVFLDLETTGLHPDKDEILEAAILIVDADLKPVYQRSWLVLPRRLPVTTLLDRGVYNMHVASGLLDELTRTYVTSRFDAPHIEKVESDLLSALAAQGFTPQSAQLAGFSIQFDRSFIACHMPDLHRYLSHRMLDVSTLRQLAKRWRPEIVKEQGKSHRAMLDCVEALNELRHYREQLFNQTSPVSTPDDEHDLAEVVSKLEESAQ